MPGPEPLPVMLTPGVLVVDCVTVRPAAMLTLPVMAKVPAIDTLPVSVVAPVTTSAPNVVVPLLLPEISRPPEAPDEAFGKADSPRWTASCGSKSTSWISRTQGAMLVAPFR